RRVGSQLGTERKSRISSAPNPAPLARPRISNANWTTILRSRWIQARLVAGAAFSRLEPDLQLAASAKYSTVPPIRRAGAMIGQRAQSECQRFGLSRFSFR